MYKIYLRQQKIRVGMVEMVKFMPPSLPSFFPQ